jgi:hypothetical protein
MSEDAFHVHGPHDHQIEHAAEHGATDRFSGRIAVTTAILATVGALFSYQGGATQAEAQLAKNDAAIRKTEAADQWSYYQSKGNKQNLAELAAILVAPEKQEGYRAQVAKYETDKTKINQDATRLEVESKHFDEKSEALMHEHHRWAQATTFLQIAIALSAIALLTRRNWLQWGVYAVATAGGILGALAFLHL